MVARERIILTCDLCGTEEEGVETHTVSLDGKKAELELCRREFTDYQTRLERLLKAGRSLSRSPHRRRKAG